MDKKHQKTWMKVIESLIMAFAMLFFIGTFNAFQKGNYKGAVLVFAFGYGLTYFVVNDLKQ